MIGFIVLVAIILLCALILEVYEVPLWLWAGICCVFLLALSGCTTAPPSARVPTACQPLPACDIPTGSNSTQLEEALWKCVMEYRALYSVCYHIAKQDEADASR